MASVNPFTASISATTFWAAVVSMFRVHFFSAMYTLLAAVFVRRFHLHSLLYLIRHAVANVFIHVGIAFVPSFRCVKQTNNVYARVVPFIQLKLFVNSYW